MDAQILNRQVVLKAANDLTDVVRFLAMRGWAPATSSNFSVRLPVVDRIAISKSGVDKYAFSTHDVMVINRQGQPVAPKNAKPSAETLLHTVLYEHAEIGAVLHTHSVNATVLSMTAQDRIEIEGFELLKGLSGNQTHDLLETVPVFANTQDMVALSSLVRARMKHGPAMHGFLIASHGLYTWGRDLAEARRHVETFEFLFECLLKMRERT